MDESNRAPLIESSDNANTADETIDLTTVPGAATGPAGGGASGNGGSTPRLVLKAYDPDQQRDYVRLIVTVGLLLMLGWVIVWSCIESASWSDHWAQTKEMLQIILPALTGLIGSVIGFYFGSGIKNANTNKSNGSNPAK
jgi:hypothetical protein